ncbi:MAG: hypothetical protein JWQ76_5366 [Ramlibacter sp.]|nr:hypothetical protein [Ramlibacter sp.]
MCYGIRAMQAEPGREGASQPSPGLERLRPRVLGAAMAVLVAGFAAAALLEKPASPRVTIEKPAAAVPAAEKAALPPNGVVEQTSMGVDDGVPTALNETRSRGGDCHHGL